MTTAVSGLDDDFRFFISGVQQISAGKRGLQSRALIVRRVGLIQGIEDIVPELFVFQFIWV